MLVASATVMFYVIRLTVRFTNATDTVLGIGVETTNVAEEAIEKGRCVEFYVMDDDKRGMLTANIQNVFRTVHSRGLFQVRYIVEGKHRPSC